MADQTLELLVKLRADVAAGFDQINNGLTSVKKTAADTQKEVGKFSDRMASMAGAVDQVSKKLASLGDAAGLPTGALRTLSDVADVAEVGLNNIGKGAVGFNAASLGAAGAGLALGTAIGSWLNTFPEVQRAADLLTTSILGMEHASVLTARATSGLAAQQKVWAKSNEEAVGKQIAYYKAHGKSVEEIADIYRGKAAPALKTTASIIDELVKSHKKATEATKKHQESVEQAHAMLKKQAEETVKFWQDWEAKGTAALDDMQKNTSKAVDEMAKRNIARFKDELEARKESYDKMTDAMNAWSERQEAVSQAEQDRQMEIRQGWIDTAAQIADVVDALAGLLNVFGISAESSLGKAISAMQDFAHAGEAAAASMANFASGNILAGIGGALSALGGVAKGVKGLFFGGQEEHKKVNDMRDGFVAAAGGLDQLNKKAHEAGLTLDRVLRAKTVKEYEAAVAELEAAFGKLAADQALAQEAQDGVNAAMERWGLTVDQMGPKFAQQELDKQAASLLQDYQLLTAAGADHNVVLEKMGGSINEYVQASLKAGTAIPEAMRPVIEQMIQNGELLDENGEAYKSAEDAGITFAQSMSEQFETLIEKIDRMVNALLGINDIEVSPKVHIPDGSGGGGGNNPKVDHLAGGGIVTGWGVPAVLHGTPDAPEYVLQSSQLKDLLKSAMSAAAAGSGGSGPPVIVSPQISLDGAALTRGVSRRQDMGYGSSKRRTRRRA